jgi:hypothetical protein
MGWQVLTAKINLGYIQLFHQPSLSFLNLSYLLVKFVQYRTCSVIQQLQDTTIVTMHVIRTLGLPYLHYTTGAF